MTSQKKLHRKTTQVLAESPEVVSRLIPMARSTLGVLCLHPLVSASLDFREAVFTNYLQCLHFGSPDVLSFTSHRLILKNRDRIRTAGDIVHTWLKIRHHLTSSVAVE